MRIYGREMCDGLAQWRRRFAPPHTADSGTHGECWHESSTSSGKNIRVVLLLQTGVWIASLQTYMTESGLYRPAGSSLQMDEVYDGRITVKSRLAHHISPWSLSKLKTHTHYAPWSIILTSQVLGCRHGARTLTRLWLSSDEKLSAPGAWPIHHHHRSLSTKRWKLQVSWFVQLTTKIDSRARATWSSVFFHNLKTQIQKIWKKI
jgi:hypothetical protein